MHTFGQPGVGGRALAVKARRKIGDGRRLARHQRPNRIAVASTRGGLSWPRSLRLKRPIDVVKSRHHGRHVSAASNGAALAKRSV
ncbi:hypothetical protein SBBP2_1320023 [Burkholderiales bacterium]|nr:hypothetical protein SBBP2_1320023 [Burkholderiales bacterium]